MKDDGTPDYEIGYGKPPKSSQFKKGSSGNPSGRPKKPTDLLSALLREGDSGVPIQENGRPKKIKKRDLVVKQVWHKAATGSIQAQRLLFKLLQQAHERGAETEQNLPKFPNYPSANPEDLTDGQLAWIIMNTPEYAALKEEESRNGPVEMQAKEISRSAWEPQPDKGSAKAKGNQ